MAEFSNSKLFQFATFFILLFVTLCHGLTEAGQKIVALQSSRVTAYDEALRGFGSVCTSKITKLFVSELERTDVVKKIYELKPDLILAIGMDGLTKAKMIKNIPVVYFLVPHPQFTLSEEKNITGVSMNIAPERQLIMLLQALPDIKNIALLYDPDRTGPVVQGIRDAAGKMGIKLTAREVHSPRHVPSVLMDMKTKIDIFWMLPDITLITPETLESMLLFSMGNKIPILTFSEKYVEMGALLSIGIDVFDIGVQAGEMAEKILSGRDVKNIQPVDPIKAVISINPKVGKGLEIAFDEKFIKKARMVNTEFD